jgi:Tfp pilus assembly protein PilN
MAQVQINLLTRELRASGPSVADAVIRWMVIVGVLGIVVTGGFQYLELASIQKSNTLSLTELQQVTKKAEPVQKMISLEEGVAKEQKIIKDLQSGAANFNAMLAIIQLRTPPSVGITTLGFRDGAVNISCTANQMVDIEVFVDSLKSEKIFSSVEMLTLALKPSNKPVQASISLKFVKGGQK